MWTHRLPGVEDAPVEDPRIEKLREILVSMRDDAVKLLAGAHDFSGDEAHAEGTLDAYHGVARAFDLLDESSSASRQHYIETGAYLLAGEEF